MEKLVINGYSDFEHYVGKELGVSDYYKITQEQINKFAEATLDYQWIHFDVERARQESPFGKTIAHGYLYPSLLPYLWKQIVEVNNVKMFVNYGIEKLKFGQPVLVDSEVRVRVKLNALNDLRGIAKSEFDVVLEIKNQRKPALSATVIFLYHFNGQVQSLQNV